MVRIVTSESIPQDPYAVTLAALTQAPPHQRHAVKNLLPFSFTLPRLKELPLPEGKYYTVKDSEQAGLTCVIYSSGKRTFQVYRRLGGGGAPVRVTLGAVGDLPMKALKDKPSVRGMAAEIIAQIRAGTDPNLVRKEQQAQEREQAAADAVANITLGQAFEKCLEIQPVAPRTLAGYRQAMDRDLAPWKDKPLKEITGAMAVTRHAELAQAKTGNPARAMQVLRKVHRFASQFWGTEDNELPFGRCPVDKVNAVARSWAKTAPRTRKLGDGDIGPWLAAVRNLPQTQKRGDGLLAAHYLELMLLTGLRRREAAFLRWADVDLRRKVLTVRDTKNHTDHTLPITLRVEEILKERKAALAAAKELAERKPKPTNLAHAADLEQYVIGLEETRHQIATIRAETGILVSAHDLRRTWASLADKAGVGAYAIKAILNHKTTGDVTGTHYAQVDVDDMRRPMQQVENYILAKLAAARGENVIPLRPAREAA